MALETESTSSRQIVSSGDAENEADSNEEEEEEIEQLLPNTTIVTHCILKNDPQRFSKCFDDDLDPYKDEIMDLINQRDDDGKSPLDIAAKLGRIELTRELLARGAEVNDRAPTGYSCLHYAAAWGRLKVLKIHIEHGGNVQHKNVHGERPIETAERYAKPECVAFLEWAEAKSLLQEAIRNTQETITEADKTVAGRISKEEKNIALNTCKEKLEWLDKTLDATTEDFNTHRNSLSEICQPIIQKMNEPPPEKQEKK